MDKNCIQTPHTIRGVIIPKKEDFDIIDKGQKGVDPQHAIIDWFQFTILDADFNFIHNEIFSVFKNLFNIDSVDVTYEGRGINGYSAHYYYGKIKAYFHPMYEEKGINFLLSGEACREFELLNISWLELFKRLSNYRININRIDIAIDDFTDKYFTTNRILHYRQNSLISSKFRTSMQIDKNVVENNEKLGIQIQFGSKASLCEITFYDKIKEREQAGYEIDLDVKFWTRTELRFRHEYAKQVYEKILNNENVMVIAKGILQDKIRFLKPNDNEKKKSRWPLATWYTEFLENIPNLKLETKTIETSIVRKRNWFSEQIAPTFLLLSLADMIDLSLGENNLDFVKKLLLDNIDKIGNKEIKMINDYRLSKGQSEYTREEIIDYLSDINDVVIINDRGLD